MLKQILRWILKLEVGMEIRYYVVDQECNRAESNVQFSVSNRLTQTTNNGDRSSITL